MSREILFKAKVSDKVFFVEGYYFKTPLSDENSGTNSSAGWFFLSDGIERHCISRYGVAFVIDPETLGQYTGLKDKNGAKIFEGDILKFGEYLYVVKWDIRKALFGIFFLDNERLASYPFTDSDRYEVIGNIHQKADLL